MFIRLSCKAAVFLSSLLVKQDKQAVSFERKTDGQRKKENPFLNLHKVANPAVRMY